MAVKKVGESTNDKLLVVMAGRSTDTMEIGGIDFECAPLTMREYADYLMLPEEMTQEQSAEWIAKQLKKRRRNQTSDEDKVTGEWVLDNIPAITMPVIRHVLINGVLPPARTPGDDVPK